MQTVRNFSFFPLAVLLPILLVVVTWGTSDRKDKVSAASIRWAEGQPGCTFTAGDDGKYRYSLWTDDFGITLAVDSQELQRTRRRLDPFLGFFLTIRYRGSSELHVHPDKV